VARSRKTWPKLDAPIGTVRRRYRQIKASTQHEDFWSVQLVVIPLLAFLAFLWSNRTDDPIWSPFFVDAIKVIAVIGILWSLFKIVCSHTRQGMSLLAGIFLMSAGTYFCSNIFLQNRLMAFDRIVEAQRASTKGGNVGIGSKGVESDHAPLQMFVSLGNWHGNRSSNGEFEYVVFDETDQVALYPETLTKFLPYPGAHFSTASTNGHKAISRIREHYYLVIEN
jgi:hypothetical protein